MTPLSNKSAYKISEGSCDNEDCVMSWCWKFSFAITEINYIIELIKIENSYFKLD